MSAPKELSPPPSTSFHPKVYASLRAIAFLVSILQLITVFSSCRLWARTKPTHATIYFAAFLAERLRSFLSADNALAIRKGNYASRVVALGMLIVLCTTDIWRFITGYRRDGPSLVGMWTAMKMSVGRSFTASGQSKSLGQSQHEREDSSDPTQPLYWFTSFIVCFLQVIAVVTIVQGLYDDYIVVSAGPSGSASPATPALATGLNALYTKDLRGQPSLAIMSVAVMGCIQNVNAKGEEWKGRWLGLSNVLVYCWFIFWYVLGVKYM